MVHFVLWTPYTLTNPYMWCLFVKLITIQIFCWFTLDLSFKTTHGAGSVLVTMLKTENCNKWLSTLPFLRNQNNGLTKTTAALWVFMVGSSLIMLIEGMVICFLKGFHMDWYILCPEPEMHCIVNFPCICMPFNSFWWKPFVWSMVGSISVCAKPLAGIYDIDLITSHYKLMGTSEQHVLKKILCVHMAILGLQKSVGIMCP